MFTTFSDNTACIMPVCYHPTTTLLVDDDADFVHHLSRYLNTQMQTLAFTDPTEAIRRLHEYPFAIFKKRFLCEESGKVSIDWTVIQQEIYNTNRFNEIMTSVIDYEMPNKTGFDFMYEMESPAGIPFHSYILLTGVPAASFAKEEFATSREVEELISKSDPDYLTKLKTAIKNKNTANFQWFSYEIARSLSLDPTEKTSFLFEGNFLPILNQYIQDNQICELYLFDKQGSLLFLDNEANLSWLFVRNEQGIENTIRLATQYHAPNSVTNALRSKEKILTLYNPDDLQHRQSIHWDDYLLPANILPANGHYTQFFNLKPTQHYYAFTKQYPEHGIEQDNILSYKRFREGINPS